MTKPTNLLDKVGYSMLNRIATFTFGFSTFFLLVRYLPKEQFGIYGLFTVILTFIESGRNGFIQNGFIKYYLANEDKRQSVINSSTALNLGLSISSSLVLFTFSWQIGSIYNSEELTKMVQIYALSSIILIPYSQTSYYLNAITDFKKLTLLSVTRYGSYFIMVGWAFMFQPNVSLSGFISMQAISFLLGSIAAITFVIPWKKVALSIDFELFKKMYHFGKYIFGTGLTSFLTRSVDQLMIGYFISAEAVASYNTAGRFLNFFEIPITSLSQVYYPKIAQTTTSNDFKNESGKLYIESTSFILAAILPFALLLLLCPQFFIILLAGEAYLDAVPILQIFVGINLLKPFGTQTGAVIEAAGKPKIIFYSLFASVVLNIAFNYFLIQTPGPYGGYIGAAIASVLSTIFFISTAIFYLKKESNFNLLEVLFKLKHCYRLIFSFIIQKVMSKK